MAETPHPLDVVLYQPEIPQNTGNVARTCVALGAQLWLVRPLGFRLTDKQLRRAGLDYWPHLKLAVVDGWSDLEAALAGRPTWFFTKTAARSHFQADFAAGDVLVFGSEAGGLPQQLLAGQADRSLRIPMQPEVRSLNLANAVAVAAYEALRQIGGRVSSEG